MRVSAEAQADDGMTVRDLFTLVERNLQDLPPMADLAARARQIAERLRAQRTGADRRGVRRARPARR